MSQQIQITGGAKVRDLQDVIIGTSGVLSSVAFNVANGVPKLDVNGKILVSQLPNSVMEYKGVWNAATNSPTLTNGGAFNQGDVYLCDTAGTVNFGSGSPISFIVGDQAIYSGSVWQKAGGATGTVTSVGLSTNGGAITIGNSPITTSGVISANFNGTNLQYVNGAGNLTTFPTLITSIGLSMPSAFSVANSPLTANGTIAVTGAGTTAQYIRGDGSLATFPTIATEAQRLITEVYNETGATLTKGTVVYINGGHGNLPTITKAIATGDATSAQTYGIVQTDITNMNNGYVVVIGSLGDLDTQAYANGTQLYLSSTTAGAWTSVKQYAPAHLVYVGIVTRSHPTQGVVEVRIQNGFEMDELHNVSAQSPLNNQGLFYNTSTSLWENKSIATALGYTPANDALVVHNTGNETIGGTKTFSDATKNNGGIFLQNASSNSLAGYMNLGGLTNGVKFTSGGGISNTFTLPSATGYTFTFPNATGTIALTSDIPSITGLVPYTGATGNVNLGSNELTSSNLIAGGTSGNAGMLHLKSDVGLTSKGNGYTSIGAYAGSGIIQFQMYTGAATYKSFTFSIGGLTDNTNRQFTLPNASGTLALTSDLTGGTVTSVAALTIGTSGTDLSSSVANSTTTPVITLNVPTASATNRGALSSADWTTFNNKQSALTNPVLASGTWTSGYLPKINGTYTIGNSLVQDNGSTVSISTSSTVLSIDRTGGATALLELKTGGTVRGYLGADASVPFIFFNQAASPLMQLNASGNLGLGVTPSAWSAGSTLDINSKGAIHNSGTVGFLLGQNVYYDAGYKYKANGFARSYVMDDGGHSWNVAGNNTSGAGAAITFTQAMTLTAAGYLSVSGNVATNNPPSYQGLSFGWNKSNGYGESLITYTNIGGGSMPRLDFGYWNGTTYSIQTTIFNSGNVLIGSSVTDAGFKLDVNGTGRFSNSVTFAGGVYNYVGTNRFFAAASGSINYLYTGATSLTILNQADTATLFTLANSGAATFSSSVTSGNINIGTGGTEFPNGQLLFTTTTSGSYVGIGTQMLGAAVMYFDHRATSNTGSFVFRNGTGGGSTLMTISSAGSVTATSFFESSDSRLKTLIQDNYQTKGIASITPKLYTKNGKVELGYYAQDFVGILDSAVSKSEDDMLSLSYREVHTAKIYALEQEIKDLKAKMN